MQTAVQMNKRRTKKPLPITTPLYYLAKIMSIVLVCTKQAANPGAIFFLFCLQEYSNVAMYDTSATEIDSGRALRFCICLP